MANDDYLGLTIINHGKHPLDDDNSHRSSMANSALNDDVKLHESEQDNSALPTQTLEDTLLTIKEITDRLITLEKDFSVFKAEMTKKIEHLEKRVKADNRSLAERILEIQEES